MPTPWSFSGGSTEDKAPEEQLLAREDEIGDLARLFRYVSGQTFSTDESDKPKEKVS